MNVITTKPYLIFLLLIISFGKSFAQLKISNTPEWVVKQSYDPAPAIDLQEISYGLLTLLSDEQVHIAKQERYMRLVQHITDGVGVQEGSTVSINYDPSFQQLYLHEVRVVRNGAVIDKLNVKDFQIIRQESNSESHIYDGSLNAVAHLADIRKGDFIDVSYTIKGFNPIHGGRFSTITSLNSYEPVGKINFYLVSAKQLHYKAVNTTVTPDIGRYKGYRTYHWQTNLAAPPLFEDNMPSWYLTYASVFISDFERWDAVVDWALRIFEMDAQMSEELRTKIEFIKANADSEGERITATLKFVQEEIRYLGLESGIGAYKPFSPSKVLSQRFGDCKDKSWLMVTMLRQMGIKAYPVLINTTFGESLHEFLPSPTVFDHVVVNVVDSTNTKRFYDPTINNQFGGYKGISFPNYGKALIIKQGVNALEQIVPKQDDLVEVFDTFDLPTVGGPGTLNVMTVYRDAEADAMRSLYKSNSLSSLSKDFKDYYSELYDGVEVLKPPVFDDDSLANRLLVEESYKINSIWTPLVGDHSKLSANFTAYGITDIFMSPDENVRKTPFELYYPARKKHQITVKLPRKWAIAKSETHVRSKSFDYSMKVKSSRSKDILYLNYEYHNKHSFVAPEDYDEYYTKVKEAEQSLAYYVYIPKRAANRVGPRTGTSPLSLAKTIVTNLKSIIYWVFGIVFLIIIGLAFIAYTNRPSD